eukprot:763054-Hanusia_phi.AAC.3
MSLPCQPGARAEARRSWVSYANFGNWCPCARASLAYLLMLVPGSTPLQPDVLSALCDPPCLLVLAEAIPASIQRRMRAPGTTL